MQNDSCYRIETIHFENPMFKKIPLSVLITMEDSKRRENYMKELKNARPTHTVIILHNKGFKTGYKEWVHSTIQDIWHANQKAISLSENHSVLILEDDVKFLPAFKKHADTVEQFFIRQKDACSYNLGSHVLLSIPSKNPHIRVLLGGMNQAVLYNVKAIHKMKSITINIVPHDLVLTRNIKTFVFKIPLTFQILTNTLNSKQWNVAGLPLLVQKDVMGFGSSEKSFKHSHYIAAYGGILPFIIGTIAASIFFIRRIQSPTHSMIFDPEISCKIPMYASN